MSVARERFITALNNLGSQSDPGEIYDSVIVPKYKESHRRDHDLSHIENGIKDLVKLESKIKQREPKFNTDKVVASWPFHDFEYNTRIPDRENVGRSASKARYEMDKAGLTAEVVYEIGRNVLVTNHIITPQTIEEMVTVDMDKARLGYPRAQFNKHETGVLHEYHWVIDELGREKFADGRADILQGFLDSPSVFHTPEFKEAFGEQANKNMLRSITRLRKGILPGERLAVYAGSFDPLTNGHLYVIEQSVKTFDHVEVSIGVNPFKKPRFSVDERLGMIADSTKDMPNVRGSFFEEEYAVTYADKVGADFLIRGLRDIGDLEMEKAINALNNDIAKSVLEVDLPSVYFIPPPQLIPVSSSMIMALVGFNGWENLIKSYVPLSVSERLVEKYGGIK